MHSILSDVVFTCSNGDEVVHCLSMLDSCGEQVSPVFIWDLLALDKRCYLLRAPYSGKWVYKEDCQRRGKLIPFSKVQEALNLGDTA